MNAKKVLVPTVLRGNALSATLRVAAIDAERRETWVPTRSMGTRYKPRSMGTRYIDTKDRQARPADAALFLFRGGYDVLDRDAEVL